MQLPGRLQDAVNEYEATLRLNPAHAATHNNLANALVQLPGQLDDAIAPYEAALRLQPAYVEGWCNLGVSRHEQGNLPAAEQALREACACRPTMPLRNEPRPPCCRNPMESEIRPRINSLTKMAT